MTLDAMKEDQYANLKHMFGCYFHQDWDTEGDDWPDLVTSGIDGAGHA